MSSNPAPLWTVQDVARFLQVSRSWVYQKTAAGELPCLHVGGLLRFEPEAVRAWVKGERPPASRLLTFPQKSTR
ncbi:helix-turn-helix domain-containing protein [Archangium primigenium]|uniref:helix-turn-helix domain-containing protein n=1 Tax=[Archangium] primigenium TaxID=2792470 RepID=UPI001959793A|nr:helix-turn-helix domain-containing protein [Archangium primigenium]MBM7117653.1 helix-turn-helix domain-containing protein [Archangium primigenium]